MLEPFLGKSEFGNAGRARRRGPAADAGGERHHARLAAGDGLDGVERDFYVRQLWDSKDSADVETMDADGAGGVRASSAAGRSLARTRARATRSRSPRTWARATPSTGRSREFAEPYADQNERDFEALREAARSGRIEVMTGL